MKTIRIENVKIEGKRLSKELGNGVNVILELNKRNSLGLDRAEDIVDDPLYDIKKRVDPYLNIGSSDFKKIVELDIEELIYSMNHDDITSLYDIKDYLMLVKVECPLV